MAKVSLQGPGIQPLIRQGVTAGVPQRERVMTWRMMRQLANPRTGIDGCSRQGNGLPV
jgi:hypothetical protein